MAQLTGSHATVIADHLDRDDWLQARQHGMGGSDALVVCGLSRFTSPLDLWHEKLTEQIVDDDDPSEAIVWGNLLEPVVRDEVARREHLTIIDAPALLAHRDHPWQQASLDGIIVDDGHRAIYEGKTAGARSARWWDDGAVPMGYVLQVQHYLSVTGWDDALIGCLVAGQRLELRRIVRDDELIGMLTEIEAEFWSHVEQRREPPAEQPRAREVRDRIVSRAWSADVTVVP